MIYIKKFHLIANLSDKENIEWSKVKARYDVICNAALANNVSVLIDAEESWIQSSIDEIYENLILKYNSKKAIVYNTVQSYRTDRLEYIEKTLSLLSQH